MIPPRPIIFVSRSGVPLTAARWRDRAADWNASRQLEHTFLSAYAMRGAVVGVGQWGSA